MKILQINKYPSIKGGTEVVLFDTIELLKEKGHSVVLFSTDEGRIIYEPNYTIPYPNKASSFTDKVSNLRSFFYNRNACRELESLIKKEKPDVAHIHLYLNGLSQSILPVLKKHKIPVVMTLHEYRQICPSYLLLDRHQNICEKCKTGNYLNCMLSRCSKGSLIQSTLLTMEMYYRRAFYKTEKYVDRFICVSNFLYKKHKEFNADISSKSLVIYNPIKTSSDREFIRGSYLLCFGRLSEEKGLKTLISAMEKLPHISLKIVGEGDMIFNATTKNIEFLGFKDKVELVSLVSNAMFTIVPSECYETFGLSCAESLSLGTPVIASDIGALPEIVEHEKNGFLFQPKDVMRLTSLIQKAWNISDQEYESLVEQGYRSVDKFSPANYISKLMEVYISLIKA